MYVVVMHMIPFWRLSLSVAAGDTVDVLGVCLNCHAAHSQRMHSLRMHTHQSESSSCVRMAHHARVHKHSPLSPFSCSADGVCPVTYRSVGRIILEAVYVVLLQLKGLLLDLFPAMQVGQVCLSHPLLPLLDALLPLLVQLVLDLCMNRWVVLQPACRCACMCMCVCVQQQVHAAACVCACSVVRHLL